MVLYEYFPKRLVIPAGVAGWIIGLGFCIGIFGLARIVRYTDFMSPNTALDPTAAAPYLDFEKLRLRFSRRG